MNFGIFRTWTVSHVDGKLEHDEPIMNQLLPEVRSRLPLLLCVRRKVKENEYPHNSVFAEAIHLLHFRIYQPPALTSETFYQRCCSL